MANPHWTVLREIAGGTCASELWQRVPSSDWHLSVTGVVVVNTVCPCWVASDTRGNVSVQGGCWQTGLQSMGLFMSCRNPLFSPRGTVVESSFLGHRGTFYGSSKGQASIVVYVCARVCACVVSTETNLSNHFTTLILPFFPSFSCSLVHLFSFFLLPPFPSFPLPSFSSLPFLSFSSLPWTVIDA